MKMRTFTHLKTVFHLSFITFTLQCGMNKTYFFAICKICMKLMNTMCSNFGSEGLGTTSFRTLPLLLYEEYLTTWLKDLKVWFSSLIGLVLFISPRSAIFGRISLFKSIRLLWKCATIKQQAVFRPHLTTSDGDYCVTHNFTSKDTNTWRYL